MNKNFIGIMACTEEGVIGKNGKLPWHYKDELEHFKKIIKNKNLVMGRKTFNEMASLNLLKENSSIVLTRNRSLKSDNKKITFVHSLLELKKIALPNTYMIGGGMIAELFLTNNMIEEFILTKIHKEHDGDSFFPLLLIEDWNEKRIYSCNKYSIFQIKKPFIQSRKSTISVE